MIDLLVTVAVHIVAALAAPTPWSNVELRFGLEEHYGGSCEHRNITLMACSQVRCLVLYESEPTPCRRRT